MSKSLEDALNNHAWSVSAVIFDLNAMLDDEGRPISERRADVSARVGVEMEMQKCPFEGIRNGKWMNVSALGQITQYYKDALAEMAAFRRKTRQAEATWDDMLACIVDLLAGPAIHLLQQRDAKGPVPAKMAVGHKLAAGMFGVLRGMHEQIALGKQFPVTVEAFMDRIEETGALLGATLEACAGSMPMIRKAVTALMEGTDDSSVEIDPVRLDIARSLALQVRIGIIWHLYDRVHLWSLLRGEFRQYLVPVNNFLQQKIERTANELPVAVPSRPNTTVLPGALDAKQHTQLSGAVNDVAELHMLEEDLKTVQELLREPGSPISYSGDHEMFAMQLASYLNTRRLLKEALSRVERQLRKHLGYAVEAPIRLGSAVFPASETLPWYELIAGRKLGEDGHLTGNSTRIRAAVKNR